MKRSLFLVGVLWTSVSFAQPTALLTVGQPAPKFKPVALVKGDKANLSESKITIIEFWATWCSPCIKVFPHLSELTEKYKDEVETISVHTWDSQEAEDVSARAKRVQEFLKVHGQNMRYNIVLDDDNNKIANDWMKAAGHTGIPTAFIINKDKTIAWIGHPAKMDEPLERIVNGTWTIEEGQKLHAADLAAIAEDQRLAKEIQAAYEDARASSDLKKIDTAIQKYGMNRMLGFIIGGEPNFASLILEKYVANHPDLSAESGSGIMAYVATRPELTRESADRIIQTSIRAINSIPTGKAAMCSIYHLEILITLKRKEDAIKWLPKAQESVEVIEDKTQIQGLQRRLDALKKQLSTLV